MKTSGWGKNSEVAQSALFRLARKFISLYFAEASLFFFFLFFHFSFGWTLFYGKQYEIENQLFNSAFLAEEIEKIIHF